MWFFPILVVGGILTAWLPRQDHGPPLTEYGRRMEKIEADSIKTDSLFVLP